MGFIVKTITTLGMMMAGVEAQVCYTDQAQTFQAGDEMCYGGKVFKCKEFPFTAWCQEKYFNPSFIYASEAWTLVENKDCPIACDNACMSIYG